jgi:hypothetical protein
MARIGWRRQDPTASASHARMVTRRWTDPWTAGHGVAGDVTLDLSVERRAVAQIVTRRWTDPWTAGHGLAGEAPLDSLELGG